MDYAKSSIGTPFFLSPEICSGEKYNFKTDIWMLGCVIYELCSLKKPFTGDNIVTLMRNIVSQDAAELPTHYSRELRNIVNILMKKDQNERPLIREILEMECVIQKCKELGIMDFDSNTPKNKQNSQNDYGTNNSLNIQESESFQSQQNNSNFISKNSSSSADISINNTNSKNNFEKEKKLEKCISNQNLIGDSNNKGLTGMSDSNNNIYNSQKGMINSNSISMLNAKNNNSNNNQINNKPLEKFRKKVRMPEKINKKYDSMGQQAMNNVMDQLNLGGFENTLSK
jgi:serine/threonine protein kinase